MLSSSLLLIFSMVSNFIRIIIAASIFVIAGVFLRGAIITDAQIQEAKDKL